MRGGFANIKEINASIKEISAKKTPRRDVPSGDGPNGRLARVFWRRLVQSFLLPFIATKSFVRRKIAKAFALVQGLSCRNIRYPAALAQGWSRSTDSISPFFIGKSLDNAAQVKVGVWGTSILAKSGGFPQCKTHLGLQRGNLATKYS